MELVAVVEGLLSSSGLGSWKLVMIWSQVIRVNRMGQHSWQVVKGGRPGHGGIEAYLQEPTLILMLDANLLCLKQPFANYSRH